MSEQKFDGTTELVIPHTEMLVMKVNGASVMTTICAKVANISNKLGMTGKVFEQLEYVQDMHQSHIFKVHWNYVKGEFVKDEVRS